MLKITGLKKSYAGVEVIKDITVSIEKGEVISVIGSSGTGKSTFLRCINLLETPDAGVVEFEGQDLAADKRKLNEARRKIGMVFQGFNLFTHLTVLENLMIGQTHLLKIPNTQARQTAEALLKTVGLAEKAEVYPEELSGGQKQRAAIARCLSMKPQIILFDEPTSALDPTMVGEVTSVIHQLTKEKLTMIIVTHDMDLAKNVSTRVFYMDEGGIYEDASPEVIFKNPVKEKTKAFIHRIKSFRYEIASENYDFIELMNKLINFCKSQILSPSASNKIQLIVEELVTILPKDFGAELTVSFPENKAYFEVAASYGGPQADVTDTDNLSTVILKQSSQKIDYTYANRNKLVITW